MKQKVLWMLAALMLSVVAVSCSDDDEDYESYDFGDIRCENGNVICGQIKLPNSPVDLNTIPIQIQIEIISWANNWKDFVLLEGTWQGKHAYWFNNIHSPFDVPDYFYVEAEDKIKEESFIFDEVDWSRWKCIYLWNWKMDMEPYTDLSSLKIVGVHPKLPSEKVDLNTLPEPVKNIILYYFQYDSYFFDLFEGTWKGQRAYWYKDAGSSSFPHYFYLEDGTKSPYQFREVDWCTWRSIYHNSWYSEDYGETAHPELPAEPIDLNTLPEWLQKKIMRPSINGQNFTLLKGTWKGQNAYWYKSTRCPYLFNFFYFEDGTYSCYNYEDVDWSQWKCVHDWRWKE